MGGVFEKSPSMEEVWIFSGISYFINPIQISRSIVCYHFAFKLEKPHQVSFQVSD